jgi:hypothetical protein
VKVTVPLWQLSQDANVGKWLPVLPLAVVPLWQVAHEPGAIPVWLNVAPANELKFLWQLSHEAVVWTWFAVFPVALLPLWQVAHEPGVTPV